MRDRLNDVRPPLHHPLRPRGPNASGHPGAARAGRRDGDEIAKPFAISLPAVSRHLKVLEKAGLISRAREAQWRPCKLEPKSLRAVDDWLRLSRFWDESFDKMAAYLDELKEGEGDDRPEKDR